MRLLWMLFRFRRRASQTWRLLGKEDPMTAPAKVGEVFASDLSDRELVDGMMTARAEAREYEDLDEPGPAAMRMGLVDLLLDEWADRRRGVQ